jgi:hypothetical protein
MNGVHIMGGSSRQAQVPPLCLASTRASRVPDFYTDPEFQRLPRNAREALVALWSSSETPLAGFVQHPGDKVRRRLDITEGAARSAIVALYHAGFVALDEEADQILLIGYVEAQLGSAPARNSKWAVATSRATAALRQTALVQRFRAAHKLPDTAARDTSQGIKSIAYGIPYPMPYGIDTAMRCYAAAGVEAPPAAAAAAAPPAAAAAGALTKPRHARQGARRG